MEDLNTIETVDTSPFKHLCMTIGELPASFVDSMTYYECLAWLVNYLQNTVIPAVNNNADSVEELQTAFVTLKNYVDNYFDNLNVQQEINVKLDKMASDGTLTSLISDYIDPFIAQQNANIEAQNVRISNVESLVNSAVDTTPIVVSSTDDMTDTSKIYVNTTDGKWYYYDSETTTWTIGGTYQSTGIADNSITESMLTDELSNNIPYKTIDVINLLDKFEIGGISISNAGWTYSADTRRTRTKEGTTIHLKVGTTFVIPDGKRIYLGWQSGGEYYSQSWATGTKIVTQEGDYVVLFAKTSSEETIENIAEFMAGFRIICTDENSDNVILNNVTKALNPKQITNQVWQYGTLSNSGVTYNTRRINNVEFIKFDKDTVMTVKGLSNQDFAIKCYASAQYSSVISNGGIGWVQESIKIACNKDWYYTIEARQHDDAEITDIPAFAETISITADEFVDVDQAQTNYHEPIMVYHRGLNSCRPENTLPAFKICNQLGLKYVECDVHMTSDGVPVVIHDRDLSRTTNGTGNIDDITYEQLKALHITGVMYDGVYDNTLRVPSFAEFITYMRENGQYPFIELKETLNEAAVKKVVELIIKNGMQHNCCCISFDDSLLTFVEKYSPDITVALLSENYNNTVLGKYLALKNKKGLDLKASVVSQAIVDTIHRSGGFVASYVTNDYNNLQAQINYGVDYITTDKLLYKNPINQEIENLYYQQNGTGFTYTMPEAQRHLFNDVFEVNLEVYNPTSESTINVGALSYTIPVSSDWQMLHFRYIPVPSDTDVTISLSGSNLKTVEVFIKRYITK